MCNLDRPQHRQNNKITVPSPTQRTCSSGFKYGDVQLELVERGVLLREVLHEMGHVERLASDSLQQFVAAGRHAALLMHLQQKYSLYKQRTASAMQSTLKTFQL
jgi:hypothetical protein